MRAFDQNGFSGVVSTFDFSHLPFDPFTPFPELTSPTTPTTTIAPTPPTGRQSLKQKVKQSPPPTNHPRRTWKPYGRTRPPPNTATQHPTTSSPSNVTTYPPPALINHTFAILGETQEPAYSSPGASLPAKSEQLPGRSDVISSSSTRSSAYYLPSGESMLATRPKTRTTSSELYDIVVDSAGRDGNSVRNSKVEESDISRDEQTLKSFRTKFVPIDKSNKGKTKEEDVKKPHFRNKEKAAGRKDFGKQEDLSDKVSQTGQKVEMKYKKDDLGSGRDQEHRFKQIAANLESLRGEVEATMSKVVKTMMVEKGRKERGRRKWMKEEGRRGRLRVFKVSSEHQPFSFLSFLPYLLSLLVLPVTRTSPVFCPSSFPVCFPFPSIPDICHFLYTNIILRAENCMPKSA